MRAVAASRWMFILATVVVPMTIFALLAEEVGDREPIAWDAETARIVHGVLHPLPNPPHLGRFLDFGAGTGLIVVAGAVILVVTRARLRELGFWAIVLGGVLALDPVVKDAFQRPPLGKEASGYSFPSGSAMFAMALVAALAIVVQRPRRRLLVAVCGSVFLLGHGAAIVFLSWHFASDVVAGWCLGLAWTGAVAIAFPFETTSRRAARHGMRRVLRRKPMDDFIDWLRFRLDTFPRALPLLRAPDYQPLPWAGLHASRRPEAIESRWAAIEPVIEQVDAGSAIDVGANVGLYTLRLAEAGLVSVGVERDARFARMALYGRKKACLPDAGIMVVQLDPSNAEVLPVADATLVLSVWHHFVREHGLQPATALLAEIWRHTRKVMFFETGENEMPESWGLPRMTPDAATWLEQFLSHTCEGGWVRHLGAHEALDAEQAPCRRNLFAVVRNGVSATVREDVGPAARS
jgi:membrane-associated phospholipid phosphatase